MGQRHKERKNYPISVGLIGESNSTINLANTSTAGGDLYLSDDIKNDNSSLTIKAQGGDIISTDNINLSARDDIKNIDITNHRTDSLELTVQSTSNAGNIDINIQGGVRDNARTDENELVKSWIDMGSIKGTSDYKGAYVNQLEVQKNKQEVCVYETETFYRNFAYLQVEEK